MQFGPDKEWSVIFAAFDENRSWYIKDNMQNSKLNTSIANNPEFYSSNVIYSKNVSPEIFQKAARYHPLFIVSSNHQL